MSAAHVHLEGGIAMLGLLAVVLLVGGLALWGLVWAVERRHRRDAEEVRWQVALGDALGRDGRLAVLALTVTPRIPFWNGQPATVEIEGEVPTVGLREVALRVVREELRDLDAAAKMENRLIVAAPVLRRLA